MPAYDEREVHATLIDAPAAEVEAALEGMTAGEVPIARMLMTIRSLPSRLSGSWRPSLDPDRPLLELMVEGGFTVLGHEPERELVLGTVGRFWTPRSRPMPVGGPDEFAAFARPGHAKAAMNFRLEAEGTVTRLTTETRVETIDAQARRSFARYWRVVGPGSALIRRLMLRAIRRRAESSPRP